MQGSIEVYTDGQCPLCQWVRAKVEPLDHDHKIEWLDYNDPEIRAGFAPHMLKGMAEEMHVRRRSDGRWARGFEAWLEVLRVLPRGWRSLGLLLKLWPFRYFGPIFYRWIAERRYTFFGIPPPCDPSGVCSLRESRR